MFLLEEIADMFILQLLFCCWLSLSLIKELYLLQFLSFKIKKALSLAVPLYFSGLLFYSQSSLISFFVFLPCFLILMAFFLLKKQSERNLLLELYSLLNPLEFRMKSGDSFLSAWEKSVQELGKKPIQNKIQSFTEAFKFQKNFRYPEDKELENFIKELIQVGKSSRPISRLGHLQRKIRVELRFRIKSRRALLQVRAQSALIILFYVALLVGTFFMYKNKYFLLSLASLILFLIGTIWIFNLGKRMKWSV